MNRLPIDASAKCNGTRSGVSIIRVSSVVRLAGIQIQNTSSSNQSNANRALAQDRGHSLDIQTMLLFQNSGRQALNTVARINRYRALRDDRATVQSLINKANRATRPLHAVIERLPLR